MIYTAIISVLLFLIAHSAPLWSESTWNKTLREDSYIEVQAQNFLIFRDHSLQWALNHKSYNGTIPASSLNLPVTYKNIGGWAALMTSYAGAKTLYVYGDKSVMLNKRIAMKVDAALEGSINTGWLIFTRGAWRIIPISATFSQDIPVSSALPGDTLCSAFIIS